MGCDIHNIVEVKIDGKWVPNPKPVFKNSYYKADETTKPKEDQWEWALNEFETSPSTDRNYDWFAILADVRNGRGFAGVSTGAGFDVIVDPRGIPSDASDEWLETTKEWDCDMHSHSFLYIDDFDKFDWNQMTVKYGVISLEEYKQLRDDNESPDSWCGATSGGNIIIISEDEADKVLDGKKTILTRSDDWLDKDEVTKPVDEWDISVEYSWSVLYSEWFESNIKNIVKPLRELGELYEDVRFVFGFDN
jgi:hypothetical protein